MEQKYLQTTTFLRVGKRAVLMGAVGIHPMAVDNSWQYQPQESPANGRITKGAGDAGGILLDVTPGDHTSHRSRSADFDHGPPKPP
jgi:hypothetical protein